MGTEGTRITLDISKSAFAAESIRSIVLLANLQGRYKMFIGALNPASNKATWSVLYQLVDAETDEPIDLSGVSEITIQVRDQRSCSPLLTGKLSSGEVVLVDTGVFRWTFSASQMSTLCANTYDVGCTIEQDGETVQILIGTLPIIDGIIR